MILDDNIIEFIIEGSPSHGVGAVIILVYNNCTDIVNCIESLAGNLPQSILTVLVDNGSDQDIANFVSKKYPWVHCLRLSENLGYAGGNNVGAIYAIGKGAELLYFLNDDTEVHGKFWEECEKWIHRKGASIVGSVIIRYDNRQIMQEAGVRYNWNTLQPIYRGVNELYDETISGYYSCDAVCGAGFMIKSDIFNLLEGFCEDFFLLFEETDLCLRARKLGYEVGIAGDSLVWHKGAATLGIVSPTSVYYGMRNYIWLRQRHLVSRSQRVKSVLSHIANRLTRTLYYSVQQRHLSILFMAISGCIDGLCYRKDTKG